MKFATAGFYTFEDDDEYCGRVTGRHFGFSVGNLRIAIAIAVPNRCCGRYPRGWHNDGCTVGERQRAKYDAEQQALRDAYYATHPD